MSSTSATIPLRSAAFASVTSLDASLDDGVPFTRADQFDFARRHHIIDYLARTVLGTGFGYL